MTELLEHAIERLRTLPPETQDDFARVLLRLAGEGEAPYRLTPEEEIDLEAAEEEAARGDLADEADLKAVFTARGL